MKFTVSMKDPDTLHDCIKEAVEAEIGESLPDKDEFESVVEMRSEKVAKVCAEWFKWGEYLTVEIDTEAKTCVVVPVR